MASYMISCKYLTWFRITLKNVWLISKIQTKTANEENREVRNRSTNSISQKL